jgi:hypothetical protein
VGCKCLHIGCLVGVKLMNVSKNLVCEADKAFLTAKLVSIIMAFGCKDLMAGFTLNGFIQRGILAAISVRN